MPALPKVLIASSVIERLQKLEDGAVGSLCGQVCENNFYILGMQVKTQEANVCLDLLNLQVCGAFSIGSSVEEVRSYFEDIAKDGEMYENALLLTCTKSELQTYLLVKGIVTKVTHSMVTNAQLASSFLYFRTKSDLTLNIELSEEGIEKAFEDIRKKVPAEDVAFFLTTKHLLIKGRENISGMPGITCDHRLKDLFESLQERGNKDYEVLPANLHFKQTQGSEQGSVQSFAPLLRHVRCSFENAKFLIKIDVLSVVHRNNKIGTLYDILTNSLIRSLTEIERSLLHQFSTGNKKELSTPEPYHFLPLQSSHFITVVYPKNSTDAELKKHREILHLSSGFGLDQPIFRRSQAYNFPGDGSSKGPLLNPHEGLNSGVKGGQVSLVKGLYSYHHYMQEHFDDNGWGCAYRSLQTIVSWFRLQGYTEVKVPTHKQIQECLVKIGDKQSSFIGSRQWIGSTEVSFVLETMLGVTCRILTASTGEEVGSLGSELSYHFQTHGTPIMIGGGVLAHTIIGVDYNRSTGDIKFLILDPHYTGGEDIGVITGKGWVGWKDTKFWTKNAFYNLCLPLRPIGDV